MVAAFVWRKRLRQRETYASWLQCARRSCKWPRRSGLVLLPRLRCERGVCAHVGHVLCLRRGPVLARAAAGAKDEAQRAQSSQSSRGSHQPAWLAFSTSTPRGELAGGAARQGRPWRVAPPTASIRLWRQEGRERPHRRAGRPSTRPAGPALWHICLVRSCAGLGAIGSVVGEPR